MKEPGEKIEEVPEKIFGEGTEEDSKKQIESGKIPGKTPEKTPEISGETSKELSKKLQQTREEVKRLYSEEESGKEAEGLGVKITPEVKERIIKEIFGGLPKELADLIGKGSAEDIQKRQEIIKKYPDKTKEVLMSLAFVDTAEVDELLKEYCGTGEKQGYWWAISRGLIGHTSKESEIMRNWLEFDEKAGRPRGGRWFSFLGSFRNSENFFKLKTAINRSRVLDKVLDILKLKKYSSWLTPDDSVISETGNITPDSIKRRGRYIEVAPLAVKKSLLGIPPGVSDKIDTMRKQLAVEGVA